MQKRKLQVFVSSTYTDLQAERQAAVEAILKAGHIPAGMELFNAGSEPQLDLIKRWIDESDVYLLILGGRYGSIEPKSGLSYTELEYDYAVEKYAADRKKPYFAIVGETAIIEARGVNFIERVNPQKFEAFREKVLGKISSFWGDVKDVKLKVGDSLLDYERQDDLVGWIPGDERADPSVARELSRLSSQNAELSAKLARYEASENDRDSHIKEALSILSENVSIDCNLQFGIYIQDNQGGRKFDPRCVWDGKVELSYADILAAIADKVLVSSREDGVIQSVSEFLAIRSGIEGWQGFFQNPQSTPMLVKDWCKIVQRIALSGVIQPFDETNTNLRMWTVSDLGRRVLVSLSSVKDSLTISQSA